MKNLSKLFVAIMFLVSGSVLSTHAEEIVNHKGMLYAMIKADNNQYYPAIYYEDLPIRGWHEVYDHEPGIKSAEDIAVSEIGNNTIIYGALSKQNSLFDYDLAGRSIFQVPGADKLGRIVVLGRTIYVLARLKGDLNWHLLSLDNGWKLLDTYTETEPKIDGCDNAVYVLSYGRIKRYAKNGGMKTLGISDKPIINFTLDKSNNILYALDGIDFNGYFVYKYNDKTTKFELLPSNKLFNSSSKLAADSGEIYVWENSPSKYIYQHDVDSWINIYDKYARHVKDLTELIPCKYDLYVLSNTDLYFYDHTWSERDWSYLGPLKIKSWG